MSRARSPARKIGVTTSTERLRWVALAYVVGVTLDVSWQITEGRSWFFSGSAMSLAPSSIIREKRKPRETIEGNLLLLYARNVTAFCTYFHEHTLTPHRSCVTTYITLAAVTSPHTARSLTPQTRPHLLCFLVLLFAQRKWRRRAVLQLSRARGPPRKIGVTTSTERLRGVALAVSYTHLTLPTILLV